MGIFVHPAKLRAARMFSAACDRRHVLVCEIDLECSSSNAVVVPLLAAAGPGAVEKIDPREFALGWDGRRRFFDDLQWHFVAPEIGRAGGGEAFKPPPAPSDAAELFGSPSWLAGLEPALKPQQALLDLLARRYPGHAFALCRLPAGLTRAFVAVLFEPRDGGRIFFPLLQVTDGRSAPPQAGYDHVLFGQSVALDERMLSFDQRSMGTGFKPLEPPVAPPLPTFVEANAPIDLASRRGLLPNEDLQAAPAPWGGS